MEFTYKENDNSAIYLLSGSLVGEHDGHALLEHFNERLDEGIFKVAIDLSAIKHVNSTGLGVFITLLTRARKKGGELVLINPSDYIRNLLIITKLNSIFHVFSTETEALESLAKS